MLYINQELLNTRNKDKNYKHADLVEDYHKVLKKTMEYYGKHIVIETRQRPHPDEKTGFPIYPGTKGLLLRTTIVEESNVSEWIYSDVILKKKDDELALPSPNMLIQKGSYAIDITRNPDLVYYVFKCRKVGLTEAEGKKFHIQDNTASSIVRADKRRLESKVAYLIYDGISEPNLKTLAKSFGIANVDTQHIDVVREALLAKVESEEAAKKNGSPNHRGYEEFIESSEVKLNDKIAAMCVDVEESNNLVYDAEQRSWMIDYQDGGTPFRLKELGGAEFGDPMGALVRYLIDNEDALRKVESILHSPTDRPTGYMKPSFTLTVEDVQAEYKVPKLKKWIKELSPETLTPQTMKGSEAKEILFGLLTAEAPG